MKVIQVSTPLSWRGGEQQVAYLLEGLSRKNIESPLFSPAGSALYALARERGWPTLRSPKKCGSGLLFSYQLARACRREGADLIHCHDARAHTLAIMSSLLWRNRTPIVVSRRVDFPVKESWTSVYKYRHDLVKAYLCVSDAISQVLQRVVPASSCFTVKDGVDVDRFSKPRSGALRSKLGVSPETPLVGCVAALAPHKDYFTFLRAIRSLYDLVPSIRVAIIGDGELREKLVEERDRLGLTPIVTFMGQQEHVPDLLPDLDLFLLTSKTEGLCQSLLEAMAARVPIVATNAGGIPEIVLDEKTGLLADVGDAGSLAQQAKRLLSNEPLRKQLVDQAYEWAGQHSYQRTADETAAIYCSIR